VRLLSSIQPTLAQAFMMMAPHSSRESPKPSSTPAWRARAACLLDPAMQIIGGASGEVLDRLDAVLA
jgi:hypothetical protein